MAAKRHFTAIIENAQKAISQLIYNLFMALGGPEDDKDMEAFMSAVPGGGWGVGGGASPILLIAS